MKFDAVLFFTFQSLSLSAVKIISGTIALRMTSNRRVSDRSQTAYHVIALTPMFFFDVLLMFYLFLQDSKSDYKIKKLLQQQPIL